LTSAILSAPMTKGAIQLTTVSSFIVASGIDRLYMKHGVTRDPVIDLAAYKVFRCGFDMYLNTGYCNNG